MNFDKTNWERMGERDAVSHNFRDVNYLEGWQIRDYIRGWNRVVARGVK